MRPRWLYAFILSADAGFTFHAHLNTLIKFDLNAQKEQNAQNQNLKRVRPVNGLDESDASGIKMGFFDQLPFPWPWIFPHSRKPRWKKLRSKTRESRITSTRGMKIWVFADRCQVRFSILHSQFSVPFSIPFHPIWMTGVVKQSANTVQKRDIKF